MVDRVRRNGTRTLVGGLIALGLATSSWLAYSMAAPAGGTYPVTAAKVTGGGFIGTTKATRTSFGFEVQRKKDGTLKGKLQVQMPGKHKFHGDTVSSLTVVGNTASWTGGGRFDGAPGFTFAVSVVDNSPDTFAITIKNPGNAVVFSASGPLAHGQIKIH